MVAEVVVGTVAEIAGKPFPPIATMHRHRALAGLVTYT